MELIRNLSSAKYSLPLRVLVVGIAILGMLGGCGDDSSTSSSDEESPVSFTTPGPPSNERLELYDVSLPADANRVSYWSNEGWMGGQLWVQFESTPSGLDDFLESMSIDRTDFVQGIDPFSKSDKRDAGWNEDIEAATLYFGYESPGVANPAQHEPSYRVIIDESDPSTPVVYVTALIV